MCSLGRRRDNNTARKVLVFMERHFGIGDISCWTVEFSRWTAEMFMLNGRDFYVERSKFTCWTVKIFMMNGPDFQDERFRFLW